MPGEQKNMKRVGVLMSVLMGITLSLILSLVGLLHAGQFSLVSWGVNFAISFVISMLIGLVVPIKRVMDSATGALGLKGFPAHIVGSLISDCIYTPLITLAMVSLAYAMVKRAFPGAPLSFLPMFLGSLAVCMAVGFVLIMVCTPVFVRLLLGGWNRPHPGE